MLAPGGSGSVTLSGTWPDNRTVTVTADSTVTLTNSIKAADTKTLNVNFAGISEAGSNIEAQTFTKGISVDPIVDALFGTWSGKFNYNVETTTATVAPVLEGDGQVFFTALPETLSFRSTAPIGEFQEVQVNGETVDPSNYTVTEGSTIITLHEDYLMTLGAEAHQITVVSDSGSPSAGFSVRDNITYEEGDYIYTIMQSGFESLEEMRTYYKIYIENMYGMSFDDMLEGMTEEEAWYNLSVNTGLGLTENTFVPVTNYSKYWAVAVKYAAEERTHSSYGQILNKLLGFSVTDMTSCFYGCVNLVNAPAIPDSIVVWDNAFTECASLKEVVIPNGVTSVGYGTFADCENLTSITIPAHIAYIDYMAFSTTGTSANLTSINYDGSMDDWNTIEKHNTWNSGCGEITVTCTDGTVIAPAHSA